MSLTTANSSLLNTDDFKEVMIDFSQALYVAFDKVDCFVMTEKTMINYRINADGTFEKLVVNQLVKNFVDKLINSDASQEI